MRCRVNADVFVRTQENLWSHIFPTEAHRGVYYVIYLQKHSKATMFQVRTRYIIVKCPDQASSKAPWLKNFFNVYFWRPVMSGRSGKNFSQDNFSSSFWIRSFSELFGSTKKITEFEGISFRAFKFNCSRGPGH